MNSIKCVLMIFALVAVAGCAGLSKIESEKCENVSMVTSLLDESVGNAVIAHSTIWPWHFIANTSLLNELGERDLELLSEHFKAGGGTLHLRSAADNPKLYRERLARVRDFLREKGVDLESVAVDSGLPGGEGLPSGDVMKALAGGKSKQNSTETGSIQVQPLPLGPAARKE